MPFSFFHPPAMDIRIFESSVLSAVTGIDYSVDRLWEAGDRIYTLRRAVAVMRENRTREQDDLSQVWFERRVGVESLAAPLDRAKWEALKNRFYALRGWNPANARPTRTRLEQLGMKGVADKLQSAGRLG
jgi:aldehyde:ferredoxin oxidoreductase